MVRSQQVSVSDMMVTRLARLARLTTSKYSVITILVSLGLVELLRQYLDYHRAQNIQPNHGDPSAVASSIQSIEKSSELPSKLRPDRILLLAYARSGSSFTGELLSSLPKAAYYFEPLFRNCSCLTLSNTFRPI